MGQNFQAIIGQGLSADAVLTLPNRLSREGSPRLANAISHHALAVEASPNLPPDWMLLNARRAKAEAPWPWDWMLHLEGPGEIWIDAISPGSTAVSNALRWWTFVSEPALSGPARVVCRELARALDAPPIAIYASTIWDLTSEVQKQMTLDQIITKLREEAGRPAPTFAALQHDESREAWSGRGYYIDDFSTWPDEDGSPH